MCWGITFKTNYFQVRVFHISRSNPILPKKHLLPYFPAALSDYYFFFLHELKATLSWLLQYWKVLPLFSLFCAQGFLAFSDNIVIHFLSLQNRYQDMIVKTLNCELRRAHIIRQPQQAKAVRAAVHTTFLPLFYPEEQRSASI